MYLDLTLAYVADLNDLEGLPAEYASHLHLASIV